MNIEDGQASEAGQAQRPEAEALVDRVQALYDAQLERVGQGLASVGDFTRRRPWTALAIAYALGLLAGRARRRPRMVRLTARR